ncbi:MAG: hypothetical protein WBC80_06535 [Isosphaeraceae bacterium]
MASVFLSKNEPDSGAEPESPHLVERPAAPLPFGRREVSIKGRDLPTNPRVLAIVEFAIPLWPAGSELITGKFQGT